MCAVCDIYPWKRLQFMSECVGCVCICLSVNLEVDVLATVGAQWSSRVCLCAACNAEV